MISNYNLTCDYHNFELKDKIYLIPDWALKVIYTDGFNEVVFSGNSANVTILEGYDISFQEETSFDERFKFSKSVSIKVDGYVTFSDLDNRYMAIIETKEGEFYLVNVDFPSFVTHTYTLNNGTNSTELVFSSQSNIATLKLINFNPNNVNSCKQYSNAKIKNVKLTEAWASYLSTWQKSLVNKGTFSDIEPLQDSISLTEEFDGEKYTVTLGFDIPMSYYKNDWHLKLLQFTENKYRGYISLEDGNKAFVGYNVGLFPSYTINGDIISIRLTETAIRGIAYGNDYAIIRSNIPNIVDFTGTTCYTYDFESSCDWEVEDKPDYITISPISGDADTLYELTICNTDDETAYAASEFVISTCNAVIKPEVIIRNAIYRYTATTDTMCTETTNERWVNSGTTCVGYDKYRNSVKQVSYDSASHWYYTDVYSATTLIEANSPDCGYIPPQPKYILTLTDSSTVSAECDSNSSITSGDIATQYSGTVVSAEIGDCITKIDEWAFSNCKRLLNVHLSDSVTVISGLAFSGCTYLNSINIPSGVTSIGNSAFTECQNISSVTIPDSVTSIRDGAFYYCSSLTSVTLSNNLEYIDNYVFWGTSLKSVGGIGSGAAIEIPSSVTHIGWGAFGECHTLSSATIPNTVTNLEGTFFRCSNLKDVTLPSGLTRIEHETFEYCSSLPSVTIPSGVTTIGSYAFRYCTSLTTITIPSGVTTIGDSAFDNCSSLTNIDIPSGVTSIGNSAFYNCSGLTSITVNAVTPPTLGTSAFIKTNNCPIYVPCEYVYIYKTASGWTEYKSRIQGIAPCEPVLRYKLTLNNSNIISAECDSASAITQGEVSAYTSSVVSTEIGDCVTEIGEYAFSRCYSLTSVTIPNSVTSIGESAFDGCRRLTNLTIPSGVTIIENATFLECSGLTSVTIPDSVTSIGASAFYYCSSLTSINIPSGVTSINGYTFLNCSSLTSIAIPSSVTSIGAFAFFDCSGLTSCTIGSGITSIGDVAFYNCTGLTGITVEATTPPTLGSDTFGNTNSCPIYVPSASVNTYKNTSGWNSYSSRIQAMP